MQGKLLDSLSGLLGFCSYFGAALVFVAVFCIIYCAMTPYNELKLIREGNSILVGAWDSGTTISAAQGSWWKNWYQTSPSLRVSILRLLAI